jgi:hypothetical protein
MDHVQDANLERRMVQQERWPVHEWESSKDEAVNTSDFCPDSWG